MKVNTLISLSLALSIGSFVTACSKSTSTANEASPTETTESTAASTASNFTKTDVKVGNGAEAKAGQNVSVHYTGWLYERSAADKHGTKFDSSRDRGTPFDFPLGGGRVIKGWDEGVVGMKVGGQRTLVIPADMAYGARGAGGIIPPNATLIFDVELIDVK